MISIYLVAIGSVLFCMSFGAVVSMRKSFLMSLVCLQLATLGVVINFVGFSLLWQDTLGQIFALFIIAVATINISVGLAIFVAYYNVHGTIFVDR